MSDGQTPNWPRELALDDEAGPAPYITRAKVEALVLGALDQANYVGPTVLGPRGAGESPMPHKPGLGARSLAAAVLLACLTVGSASAAVMWFAKRPLETPQAAPLQVPVAPQVVRPHKATVVAPEAPVPVVAPEPARDKPSARSHEPRAPEDWLVEGNRLRADKRWAKADDAYTRAAQHAPNTQTAYVARVASAAVRLEHLHDARGALSRYRAALSLVPHGALSEEIHWGIAEAQRALGDHAAEQVALSRFLQEHPSSPLAGQAKARLD
jgi:tetratricopeptide (TPR) repeat protein